MPVERQPVGQPERQRIGLCISQPEPVHLDVALSVGVGRNVAVSQ